MKRIFGVFLALCLTAAAAPHAAMAVSVPDTVRVGLFYGSSALPAPQLENAQGSGFQLGYYDADGSFRELYPVSSTRLAMLKDANYALASDGKTYEESASGGIGAYHVQLLEDYGSADAAAAAARAAGGFPAFVDGVYRVRTGSYTTQAAAQAAGGGEAVGGSRTGVTVVEAGTNTILFEYDGGETFAVAPQGARPVTWSKGYQYYGNFAYPRAAGGNLSVINYVGLDDYVKGVVPYEVSPSWPMESLKAQAVCARGYAMGNLGKHKDNGFDLCNNTNCQVYKGLNTATPETDAAVESTAGEYVAVNGEPVVPFFFSCDGGATEDASNVWGGEYGYLKGVADPYEKTEEATNGVWTKTMTADEVAAAVRSAGQSIGTVTGVAVTKTTAVGNVLEVTVTDASGKRVTFDKAKCRSIFGLNSQRYTVSGDGEADAPAPVKAAANVPSSSTATVLGAGILSGAQRVMDGLAENTDPAPVTPGGTSTKFTFSGRGWGHHVGMSQWGAKAMAEQGKTYREILQFYFTGVDIVG